jgi:very-short-patch-repair endonuclease
VKPGIHWTEVKGDVLSGGARSCFCEDEVQKVVELVQDLLNDKDFKGTVGVVTPFRPQANLIQDALFAANIPIDRAEETRLHVDTSHGFQGDERDVMFFSLCAGPAMPAGSAGFLRNEGHLFNVAVSRARAVVHVVGNHSWARRCGIAHVELLARDPGRLRTRKPQGPWHPHESPYEKLFFDALVNAGLSPQPQHPVSSRRLDMALISQDESSVKIDIEVDGDCHRNPDGTRKEDDIWRDIQLQALGWKVMRFWTYELREDMDQCVRKVMKAWRK